MTEKLKKTLSHPSFPYLHVLLRNGVTSDVHGLSQPADLGTLEHVGNERLVRSQREILRQLPRRLLYA